MSRARQVIGPPDGRVPADVGPADHGGRGRRTAIARLRERAKADFEAREGVKLTFLPFFRAGRGRGTEGHPRLNASIEADGNQVTYHDAEHLGIAVDTEKGLMVPVIRNAGDLNVGGLARKMRSGVPDPRRPGEPGRPRRGHVHADQHGQPRRSVRHADHSTSPRSASLGTGTVVRRPVVVQDAALGEVIAVRSMVYLALSYDHRLVDGADAARFLHRESPLEEGPSRPNSASKHQAGLARRWPQYRADPGRASAGPSADEDSHDGARMGRT